MKKKIFSIHYSKKKHKSKSWEEETKTMGKNRKKRPAIFPDSKSNSWKESGVIHIFLQFTEKHIHSKSHWSKFQRSPDIVQVQNVKAHIYIGARQTM